MPSTGTHVHIGTLQACPRLTGSRARTARQKPCSVSLPHPECRVCRSINSDSVVLDDDDESDDEEARAADELDSDDEDFIVGEGDDNDGEDESDEDSGDEGAMHEVDTAMLELQELVGGHEKAAKKAARVAAARDDSITLQVRPAVYCLPAHTRL